MTFCSLTPRQAAGNALTSGFNVVKGCGRTAARPHPFERDEEL